MAKPFTDEFQLNLEDFFNSLIPEENPAPPRVKKPKIANEFGNKIGGSRRDMWAKAVSISDLSEMNDAEKETFVKKDTVWPKPDYAALLAEGRSLAAVYYIKKVRDSIENKITSARFAKLYIEAVNEIEKGVLETKTDDDIGDYWSELRYDPKFIEDRSGRYITPTDLFRTVGVRKVLKALQYTAWKCNREAKEKGFLLSDDEKLLRSYHYAVIPTDSYELDDRNGSFWIEYKDADGRKKYSNILNYTPEIAEQIENGGYILLVESKIIGVYETEDEADECLMKTLKELKAKENKPKAERRKSFCYERLEQLVQSNGDETERTGEDYLNTFKFYGGEFGNYVSQNERRKNLSMCYTSFMNIARALNIEPSEVSLGGKLSIAFGARGKGNALAHYESLRDVINLTKLRGAGSLAHEFGHALDFIFGKSICGKSFAKMWDEYSVASLKIKCPEAYAVLNTMLYRNGHYSDFYNSSRAMDRNYSKDSGGYWSSGVEMFARAFACFIKDKLKDLGIQDDYLCGHADGACGIDSAGNKIVAVPMGDERKEINAAIETLISKLFSKEEVAEETA